MATNREKFQSETGRAIDSLVSSSPLFYTVSGSQGEKQSPPRYYEQLGCPSILKPSFRDLTGCTRLSVGVPSTSYRSLSIPLDKLNKTMGKSPTTQSKRYNRGEKYIPPIKVNAKIRHIYSHITSSQSSQQSSITTISTQTDFDGNDNDPFDTLSEEKVVESISKRDVSTCMSPPPPQKLPSTPESETDRLFTVPPPYIGKLEDLEKITGHIVIQRFFTRADDVFGSWLEKQLGMNNKSVGVGTSEVIDDKAKACPEFMQLDNNEHGFPKAIDREQGCNIQDVIRCECFRDYFKAQEAQPINLPKDSTTNQPLSQLEQELISQCIEYEVNVDKNELSTESKIQDEHIEELIPTNRIQNNDETENKRLSETVVKDDEETEFTSHVGDDDLDIRLKSLDLEWVNEETVEANKVADLLTSTKTEENVQELPTNPSGNDDQLYMIQNALEKVANESENLNELEIEDASPEQIKTLLTEQTFVFHIPTTKCIPDVIDVSDLLGLEKSLDGPSTDSQGQEIKDLNSLIKSDSSNLVESQSKVAEYLAELERSGSSIDLAGDEKIDYDSIDHGESSGRSQGVIKIGDDITSEQAKGNVLKRSVSIDSCIGTESSGEARHGINESCTLIDSSRSIHDELGSAVPGSSRNISQPKNFTSLARLESEDSWDKQDSQDQEVITIMSSKSIDESNSRSEMSSAIKQESDGEDADQSESDSEFSSLKRPTGSVMSAVVEELEREDIEQALMVNDDNDDDENEIDEVDQFDAIIESHEKEKRLRPVCRKRNATTQTSKSVESSILSPSTTSRSTTATSDSSFDLEFVSKSKKFVSQAQLSSGNNSLVGDKRRSYLPSGSSSLNVLNMKFTMGREFESEVSIRIPPKSPAGSISSQTGSALPGLTGISTVGTSGRNESRRSQQGRVVQDLELKNLWKDVKSRMDSRVGETRPTIPSAEMHVRGNRLKLLSADDDNPSTDSKLQGRVAISEGVEFAVNEEERIKRSLKRLKKILDD